MEEQKQEKHGWFKKLKDGLRSSSTKISEGISGIFTKRKLDQETLDALEELLIMSDIGVATASTLTEKLKKERFNQEITIDEIKNFLAHHITEILLPYERPLSITQGDKPFVMLIVGVNGSGKTTTIAKLAQLFHHQGKSVHLAACDTFRAAALDQLKVWADRIPVSMTTGALNSDPSGVAFEALEVSIREKSDILMIDTAGRLHNKKDLMDELAKIRRVLKKLNQDAPHACFLVLDATTGQNAHAQLEHFSAATPIDGLIITKLDGTAKGGVIVGLVEKYKTPIYALGVGEGLDDLKDFSASSFASALMGLESINN